MRILLVTIFLIFVVGVANGRGGGRGGGGARGGSRGGSRSSGSRSSSVRSYRGPVYSRSSWKTAAAAGTLYGLSSYQRRHLYLSNPNKEPQVCFNEHNLRNGTYGYFICPEPDQPDDHSHCCGDDDEQRCCTYSEYKRAQTIGAIVGGVIGGLVLIFVIGLAIFCVVAKRRRAASTACGGKVLYKGNTQSSRTPTSPPAYSSNVYSTPTDNGLAGNGTANGHTGVSPYDTIPDPVENKDQGPPPAYGFKDGADELPYSTNPQTAGSVDPIIRPPPYSTAT